MPVKAIGFMPTERRLGTLHPVAVSGEGAVTRKGAVSATRRLLRWDPVQIVVRNGTFGSGASAAGVPLNALTDTAFLDLTLAGVIFAAARTMMRRSPRVGHEGLSFQRPTAGFTLAAKEVRMGL